MKDAYFWKNDKICLRTLQEKDLPALEELLGNMEDRVEEERGISLPYCEGDSEILLEWVKEQTGQIWLAVADEMDRMTGYIVLRNIDERNGNAEFYLTVLPQFRRKGHASAALAILCDYAFSERRLHKLYAMLIQGNKAAEGFLSDFGMNRECVKKDMIFIYGEYRDVYYYGLTEGEYKEKKAGRNESAGEQRKEADKTVKPRQQERDCRQPAGTKDCREKAARPDFWQYEDVRLRALTVADCVCLNRIRYESAVCRMFHDDVMLPGREFCIPGFDEEHVDFGNEDGRTVFAVENDQAKCVGAIQLLEADRKNGTFSFSIYVDKAFRQKGYGAKALYLLLDYGFRQQRFHKCNTIVNEDNVASLRLMESMGFAYEGTQRDMVYYNGNYVNKIHLGMTQESFGK